MSVVLVIPVLNPGPKVRELVRAVRKQTLQPDRIIVVDSASTDGYVDALRETGAEVRRIERREFDHGGTRNLALKLAPTAEIYMYLTQDALPHDEWAFERLVAAIRENPRVGMAYGRQLPHVDAGPIGAHARLFNYPDRSEERTLAMVPRLGIRAAFCSNSFSAYRQEALAALGGFPERIIFGEDTFVAGKLLEQGWSVAYAAEAKVHHSHDYTLREDFSRYFDAGVFHASTLWFRQLLGGPGGEGRKFVLSEWRFLRERGVRFALATVIIRNGTRWLGYQAGRRYRVVPRRLRSRLGMNRGYWARTSSA